MLSATAVRATNENAARQCATGGDTDLEILHHEPGGDLAYWVGLQYAHVDMTEQPGPVGMHLRITEVFRCEDGEWKLTHRHDLLLHVRREESAIGVRRIAIAQPRSSQRRDTPPRRQPISSPAADGAPMSRITTPRANMGTARTSLTNMLFATAAERRGDSVVCTTSVGTSCVGSSAAPISFSGRSTSSARRSTHAPSRAGPG